MWGHSWRRFPSRNNLGEGVLRCALAALPAHLHHVGCQSTCHVRMAQFPEQGGIRSLLRLKLLLQLGHNIIVYPSGDLYQSQDHPA